MSGYQPARECDTYMASAYKLTSNSIWKGPGITDEKVQFKPAMHTYIFGTAAQVEGDCNYLYSLYRQIHLPVTVCVCTCAILFISACAKSPPTVHAQNLKCFRAQQWIAKSKASKVVLKHSILCCSQMAHTCCTIPPYIIL